MKTKKFNLDLFKIGKKATTKLGNPARFLRIANGKLMVAVLPRFTPEEIVKYQMDGRKYPGVDTMYDLQMVEEYDI